VFQILICRLLCSRSNSGAWHKSPFSASFLALFPTHFGQQAEVDRRQKFMLRWVFFGYLSFPSTQALRDK
jgi:hypothetical protein